MGARASAAGAGVAAGAAVVVAFLAAVLATTLRAIGRGFGSGTLDFGAASTAKADTPKVDKASTRLVARAVDRKAAARAEQVTAFPNGESFNR